MEAEGSGPASPAGGSSSHAGHPSSRMTSVVLGMIIDDARLRHQRLLVASFGSVPPPGVAVLTSDKLEAGARVGSVLDFNVGLNLEAEEKRDMDILAIQESLQQKIGRHAQDDGRGDATGAGGIANLSLEQGLDSSMLSTSIATRLVQHV